MESPNAQSPLLGLNYNENLRIQIRGAAVWAGIAAWLSLAGAILGVVLSFFTKPSDRVPAAFQSEGFNNEMPETVGRAASIFGAVIGFGIAFLFFYFLHRFAIVTRRGLEGNDPELIKSGLGSLSTYSIICGVVTILIILFFLVGMVGVAVGITR